MFDLSKALAVAFSQDWRRIMHLDELMRRPRLASNARVKRITSRMLLLRAVLVLLGQERAGGGATAHLPAAMANMTRNAAQMSSDCMEMMQKAPKPGQKPCKGVTLDCIAAMGCVVPVLMVPGALAGPELR